MYTKRAMSRPLTPPSDIETSKLDGESGSQTFSMGLKWSLADDRILLEHVLKHHKVKWTDVERELQKRHTADVCLERWECLKNKILDTYAPISACQTVNQM
jgi:hypothetical protein